MLLVPFQVFVANNPEVVGVHSKRRERVTTSQVFIKRKIRIVQLNSNQDRLPVDDFTSPPSFLIRDN